MTTLETVIFYSKSLVNEHTEVVSLCHRKIF